MMNLIRRSAKVWKGVLSPAMAAGVLFGGLLLGTPTGAQAQETQQLCAGQPIPAGWVHTNTYTAYNCPGSTNNALQIQNTAGQTQMNICADQELLPDNWLWISSGTSFTQCAQAVGSAGTSTRWNNMRTVRNVTRETQLWACMVNPSENTDWAVVTSSTNPQTCLPMSPSVSVTAPNNMAYMQRRCTLNAYPAYVQAGQQFSYTIQGPTIPVGSQGHWYGTKNGVVDTAGFNFGTVPTTMNYTNQPGWDGQYTRMAEIRTPTNILACRTNTVDQTIAPTAPLAPVCTLSVDRAVVGPNQQYTFTAGVQGSLPPGSQAYWYGTRNGQPDATGNLAGAVPASFTYTSQPSWAGVYTRYLVVRNGSAQVCQTAPVTVTLQ